LEEGPVKIAKKGDITKYGNWRGITLMSVAAKVMDKVLTTSISGGVGAKVRKQQADYRKGRSTTEQIIILRDVVEQAVEWNSSLYVCFVDYGKPCGRSWRVMGNRRSFSESSTQCMKAGVKQGCNMSWFLLLLVIDWIMRIVTGANTGIR